MRERGKNGGEVENPKNAKKYSSKHNPFEGEAD
jgi:hypothetical protein